MTRVMLSEGYVLATNGGKMPRYRFDWSNHETELLIALTKQLRLKGDPPAVLRQTYGARPKPQFIQDVWGTLIDYWLTNDARLCRSISKRFRGRGLGKLDTQVDRDYIQSVRNTSGARQILLEAFIQAGEEAAPNSPARLEASRRPPEESMSMVREIEEEVTVDPVQTAPDTDKDSEAVAPTGNLREFVEVCLTMLVNDDVFVDPDGDFAIAAGSAVVFVSVLSDPECLRIFSVALSDVPSHRDLYRILNDINSHLRIGRFVCVGDAVLLEHYLLPVGLSVQELIVIIRNIQATADYFDDRLQARFGGKTFLPQRAEDEIDV